MPCSTTVFTESKRNRFILIHLKIDFLNLLDLFCSVLLTFVEMFNSTVDSLLEKFRRLADGKTPVNLFNEINRTTLDAIALVITLKRMSYENSGLG